MIDQNELPELPEGWEWKRLGDVCTLNPKVDVRAFPDDYVVSFIPMRSVEELTGRIDVSQHRALSEVRKGYTSFQDDDVLFAKITPCMENGKVAIARGLCNGIGFGSTEFHVVRSSKRVLPEYLFHYLVQDRFRRGAGHNMTGTAGQLRVPSSYLADVAIPVAPVPVQHIIVAKLEELFTRIDAGVASLKAAQQQLKCYRQSILKSAAEGKLTERWREEHRDELEPASVLLERILAERRARWEAEELAKMEAKGKTPKNDDWKKRYKEPVAPDTSGLPELPEGWVWASVAQLNPAARPCAYGVLQPGDYISGGVAFVRVGDINDGKIDIAGLKRIDQRIADQYPRTQLEGGEVLISLVGAIGRTAVVPDSLRGGNTARAVGALPICEEISSHWVELWFRNPLMIHKMVGKSHEVARKTLNLEDVRSAEVAIPTNAEQNVIVEVVATYLSAVDTCESLVKSELMRIARLRQSILTRAFSGTLLDENRAEGGPDVVAETPAQMAIDF